MSTLSLLVWDLGVPLGFPMPSNIHSSWIQPLIVLVRDTVLIIIRTLQILKGDQLWPNRRLLILSCTHRNKIFQKINETDGWYLQSVGSWPGPMCWIGEAPQYWALLYLGTHLGNLFPFCSIGYKEYERKPHGWVFYRAIREDLDFVNNSYRYRPLDM